MTSESTPAQSEYDDSVLMLRAADGDLAAFEAIVLRHQQKLLNFFARMGVNKGKAEDLVQETFLRMFRSRRRYRPSARFTTFMYTIARNAWIDWLRKERRHEDALADEKTRAAARYDDGLGRMHARLDVSAALTALPPKFREPVILSVYQGLRYEEIAAILQIPLGTVKSRIFAAMRELRRLLDEKRSP